MDSQGVQRSNGCSIGLSTVIEVSGDKSSSLVNCCISNDKNASSNKSSPRWAESTQNWVLLTVLLYQFTLRISTFYFSCIKRPFSFFLISFWCTWIGWMPLERTFNSHFNKMACAYKTLIYPNCLLFCSCCNEALFAIISIPCFGLNSPRCW